MVRAAAQAPHTPAASSRVISGVSKKPFEAISLSELLQGAAAGSSSFLQNVPEVNHYLLLFGSYCLRCIVGLLVVLLVVLCLLLLLKRHFYLFSFFTCPFLAYHNLQPLFFCFDFYFLRCERRRQVGRHRSLKFVLSMHRRRCIAPEILKCQSVFL